MYKLTSVTLEMYFAGVAARLVTSGDKEGPTFSMNVLIEAHSSHDVITLARRG